MKPFKSVLCVLAALAVLAAMPSLGVEVVLQSQDGQDFKVDVKVANKSETIKGLVEDVGVEHVIPLPNIAGKTLAKIVEFMKELQGSAGEPSEKKHKATENTEEPLTGLIRRLWAELPMSELYDLVVAANYLDIRKEHENDVLNATLQLYGVRIFGDAELAYIGGIKDYLAYAKANLSLPGDLTGLIVKRSFRSIDRIFLDTTPHRRIRAEKEVSLGVAQIVAYIAKNQTPSADKLPEALRNALAHWDKDFASKIHFGPWPTEFATWPGHCRLPSNENYNMYSDATPDDRYIDNGDGTVTDVCTKLTWEQTPLPEAPWQRAQAHCTKLNEATPAMRKTDEGARQNDLQIAWRAPTAIELQSIVDYGTANSALNGIFREGKARYWSSTRAVAYKKRAWNINFQHGGYVTAGNISDKNRIRCVRGERGGRQTAGAKNHYTYAQHSETVTDNFTGALWQRRVTDEGRNYADLQGYCPNLVLEGTGWQLPTAKTLSTLVDVAVGAPRIDRDAFPGTSQHWFWSGSPFPSVGLVVGVNFSDGVVGAQPFADAWVRCVRWRS